MKELLAQHLEENEELKEKLYKFEGESTQQICFVYMYTCTHKSR